MISRNIKPTRCSGAAQRALTGADAAADTLTSSIKQTVLCWLINLYDHHDKVLQEAMTFYQTLFSFDIV